MDSHREICDDRCVGLCNFIRGGSRPTPYPEPHRKADCIDETWKCDGTGPAHATKKPGVAAGPYSIGSSHWPGLSKLIEEAGEVQQVAGKIIGTGGEAAHWDGSDLRKRLEEEIGDVMAACFFVRSRNRLDEMAINIRIAEKLATFNRWHVEQGGKL